ncbi:Flp family type IVb pilin [Phenylobacterium sp. LjRoot219]|uniref:Flp family type IVb pilin n=1 Tax=Phenylobacterium sp. LjRoot219 TaxID=3342283 RepID=UPI003ECC57A1
MLKTYIAIKSQADVLKDHAVAHLDGLKTRLSKDESGAALIEYTILIGLITVAAITAIIAVGTWVSGKWTALDTALV